MLGFRRRELPPIQLYGKLPLAKDYLRIGLGDGAGLAFRDWIDTTYSGAAPSDDDQQLAWPARFILGEAWNASMQGVVWPSSDAGGHRPFPFVMCVERRRRVLLSDMADAMTGTQGVWDELRSSYERCRAARDGRAALSTMRAKPIDIAAVKAAPAAGVGLEPWLDGLWPAAPRDGFLADLDRLRALRGRDTHGPLRLPLVPGLGYRQQVQAWLEVLSRLEVIEDAACPTVFFPQRDRRHDAAELTSPFLSVFRSTARPTDGAWLAAASEDISLGAADLTGGRPPAIASNAPAREGISPLAASLRAIVTRFIGATRST